MYYDYQVLCSQVYGGVSRYFYELITHLMKKETYQPIIKCWHSENRYFERITGRRASCGYHWRIGQGIKRINRYLAEKDGFSGADIIHPTGYDPYLFDCERRTSKVVVTIHDMIQERYSDSYYAHDKVTDQKKRQIFESDHIIAVSQNTKKDILEIYPKIREEKVSVIYHGSSSLCAEELIPSYLEGIPERFVLYVGQRYSYKNFFGFVKAMRPVLEQDKELAVVCAGGGKLNAEEEKAIGEYRERYVFRRINDAELAYLYKHAICFVFPSLYEGFGLTTLEAFSYGCPVLLSNTSAMPEVGGDAAIYFDPLQPDDMSAKILSVINDRGLRQRMTENGHKQVSRFDWKDTADKVYECYMGL